MLGFQRPSGEGIGYYNYFSDDSGCDDSGYKSDEDNYQCNACGKTTKTLNALMMHMECRPQCKSTAAVHIPRLGFHHPH